MKTFHPDVSKVTKTSFKIKGRMLPYEEITCRLKNFCASLGFGPVTIYRAGLPVLGNPEAGAEQVRWGADEDVVVVLSTNVAYNPNWGGHSGLPQLLHHMGPTSSSGPTPADFIAPFLHHYRFAQENIFFSHTLQGQYLITAPTTLLSEGEECSPCTLKLHLEKIVQSAKDGAICPVAISGTHQSFVVSTDFCLSLAGLTNEWTPGRNLPIGKYLSRELFSFTFNDKALESDSPYVATILPHIAEIVADPTPNLRAAQIHLQQVFIRDMARLVAGQQARSKKLLYIAGLDIDMTEFAGVEEHCFVPWQAYIAAGGKTSEEEYLLAQDDLFVRLKQQDSHCFA